MNTFEVIIRDESGEVVDTLHIKRATRANMREIIKLQQILMDAFVEKNIAIGELVLDNGVWKNIERLAKLLPILGESEKVFDVNLIADDLEQICQIFFTQSMKDNGEFINDGGWEPSKISALHHLDYQGALGKSIQKLRGGVKQKQEDQDLVVAMPT